MEKQGIIKNLIKNREYILYYAKIILRTRVSGSYLGFLWLFIDPLMFMLIYSFVVQVVFRSGTENFNVFVIIGLTVWNLFSRSLLIAATSIARNKSIFEQVYFHKFVYPTIYLVSFIYEFFISMILVLIIMLFSGIHFTPHIIEIIPVLFTCVLFTYGCSLIISHFGVYLFDLRNILEFTTRFLFYFSPVMWSYENLKFSLVWILKLNPISIIIGSFRSCLMYGKSPVYSYLIAICLFSCVLIKLGYWLITKHEDSYARMI